MENRAGLIQRNRRERWSHPLSSQQLTRFVRVSPEQVTKQALRPFFSEGTTSHEKFRSIDRGDRAGGNAGVPSLATAQRQHPAALGDLMTAFVQPRHIKLGLAGNEQNWLYAAYELDQLRETLADVAEILPK